MSEEVKNIFLIIIATSLGIYYKRVKDEYDKKARIMNEREFYEMMHDYLLKNTKDNIEPFLTTPNIDMDLKKTIKELLIQSVLPEEFKEKIQILIQTTSNHNLLLCTTNIKTIKLQRKQFSKIAKITQKEKIDGLYNVNKNEIIYYSSEALGHEILHMASSFNFEDNIFSGFKRINQCGCILFRGLNEGYTELLNRRKFYNDDYQTKSYKTNVFILRMLELLVQDKELLETAYFQGNTDFVYNSFCQYGSKQEFFKITKYLDFFCDAIIDSEDKELLEFVKDIIKRTKDSKKIKLAEDITDEYFDTTKKDYINLLAEISMKNRKRK